jgi:hypothetical protein
MNFSLFLSILQQQKDMEKKKRTSNYSDEAGSRKHNCIVSWSHDHLSLFPRQKSRKGNNHRNANQDEEKRNTSQ